jgi:outer membrane protein OmpA-like peptidoglycan-associated protein
MKFKLLLIFFIFMQGCITTQQFHMYNPYPEKEIILEQKNTACNDLSEVKLWYILYGSYPLNTINTKEVFPSPDYSYKVEQVATTGDKVISVFTGLFFSISRKTLRIETCQLVKKETDLETKPEIPDTTKNDLKLNELEKEVSFLKGKLSGIETSFTMLSSNHSHESSDKAPEPVREESSIGQGGSDEAERKYLGITQTEDSPELDDLKYDEDNTQNSKQVKPPYSYLLFRLNSFYLTAAERKKIDKLRFLLAKPKAKILIIGRADKSGKFTSNLNLSWRRALEVKKMIMKLGIKESRIELSAAGETESSPTERMGNFSRRVDIYLIGGNF